MSRAKYYEEFSLSAYRVADILEMDMSSGRNVRHIHGYIAARSSPARGRILCVLFRSHKARDERLFRFVPSVSAYLAISRTFHIRGS